MPGSPRIALSERTCFDLCPPLETRREPGRVSQAVEILKCSWCGLKANRLWAGMCDSCLGPQANDGDSVQKISRRIEEMRRELKTDWKHKDGLKSCIADYEAHLRAYEARIRAAKGVESVADFRIKQGISQRTMANALGITRQAVAKAESEGRSMPSAWAEKWPGGNQKSATRPMIPKGQKATLRNVDSIKLAKPENRGSDNF